MDGEGLSTGEDRGLASGAASLTEQTRAALLGLDPDYYSTVSPASADVKASARILLAEPDVGAMIDRLPFVKMLDHRFWRQPDVGSTVLGGHPPRVLAARRPDDNISVVASAVSGDTTTHGLVRISEVLAGGPDWILFFLGLNDARTQGPEPTKTIVHREETARNLADPVPRRQRDGSAMLVDNAGRGHETECPNTGRFPASACAFATRTSRRSQRRCTDSRSGHRLLSTAECAIAE